MTDASEIVSDNSKARVAPERLLRDRSRDSRVTNIELFFDLVYVFAVTQLSHHLLGEPTLRGALQSALLCAMVWLAWAYTTWVTNWMDPDSSELRILLIALMLVSLAMSAALPRAFTGTGLLGAGLNASAGLVVGGAYAVQQVGRSAFMVVVLRGPARWPLRRNFQRILAWCVLSGGLAVAGGLVHGWGRDLLWLLVVGADVTGSLLGFRTPGLGQSLSSDWTIEGGHFAERCQAFILIALGESIVITGATMSAMARVSAATVAAFVVAFAGSVALWWLYFDRSARASSLVIASSDDPGALARAAYHLIHPVMVAGIIVAAAGDERILTLPSSHASTASAWMILGGPALFVAGHTAFKYVIWRHVSWNRLAGIAALALLGATVPVLPEVALAACGAAVIAAVAALDRPGITRRATQPRR
ncbi:MAG TPA: low temperature requirement protein A [Trebonia sp.]|nr:low temperature requirement protein A [Trebonia sp.]